MTTQPNIIIITPHDLGDYLGCYGSAAPSANIDGLASEGVTFQQHFSTGTVCSPSRGAINTGCYPHTNGLMGLVHRGWELDVDRCPHTAQLLAAQGYQTHLFGFQHEHYDPSRLGYQQAHSQGGRHVEDVADAAVTWLGSDAPKEKPFFIGMGFSEVHRLGLMPSGFKREVYEPADPAEVVVPPHLPDIPQIRADMADFYGAIRHMDKHVGRVLDALEQAGLKETTVVIFTSDHGASFIHSKATLYDGGAKVPWIMRWPGKLPAGHVVDSVSSHVDILPTLFDLLGIPAPDLIEGQSLAMLAKGETDQGREYVFAEKNYTNFYDPSRFCRTRTVKYISKGLRTNIFDFQIPEIELATTDFRRNMEVFSFYSARRCYEELYDLEADPGELHNLVDDPAWAETLAAMRQALINHLKETNDPFRRLRNELPMHETAYEAIREMRKAGGQ